MGNTCSVSMTFIGAESAVARLHEFFTESIWADKERFSDLVAKAGVFDKLKNVQSGSIYSVGRGTDRDSKKAFEVKAFSMYVFFPETFFAIKDTIAPGVYMLYMAQEPMLDYIETNDKHGLVYAAA